MLLYYRFLRLAVFYLFSIFTLGFCVSGCSPSTVGEAAADIASHSALRAMAAGRFSQEIGTGGSSESVYASVAPSIVHLSAGEHGVGSGILVTLSDGMQYILTNAHVPWPYRAIRVVFGDGVELSEIPVKEMDMMLDLALLGPVDVEAPSAVIGDVEGLPIGSELYLIGYPSETEEYPQPTITRGLFSRYRTWETFDAAFIQTDALIAGGQSGGALVNELGEVVGISGWSVDNFGQAASLVSVLPRIEAMAAGEDVDGFGKLSVPMPSDTSSDLERFELYGDLDTVAAIFYADVPLDWWVEAKSWGDLRLRLFDKWGYLWNHSDSADVNAEYLEDTLPQDAVFFLIIDQFDETGSVVELSSSTPFELYFDPDDYVEIEIGEELSGYIDYPGDWDSYLIELVEGETIAVDVESLLLEPYLYFMPPSDCDYDYIGVPINDFAWMKFGSPAIYRAPADGQYTLLIVSDSDDDSVESNMGGYVLRVGEAPADAVPMIVPLVESEWSEETPVGVEEDTD